MISPFGKPKYALSFELRYECPKVRHYCPIYSLTTIQGLDLWICLWYVSQLTYQLVKKPSFIQPISLISHQQRKPCLFYPPGRLISSNEFLARQEKGLQDSSNNWIALCKGLHEWAPRWNQLAGHSINHL